MGLMRASKRIAIDKADFRSAKKAIDEFDTKREAQIRSCRDVIRISKKIIYAVHRDDLKTARLGIKQIKQSLKAVGTTAYENNMVSVAWQEYVEAICYYYVVVDKKLPTRKQLGVKTQEYLLGLCDLCGELVRRAVNAAAKGDVDETLLIKSLVEDIFGLFLQFDLRNSELRKKSDGLKYHLNKLETVVYDLKVHKRS